MMMQWLQQTVYDSLWFLVDRQSDCAWTFESIWTYWCVCVCLWMSFLSVACDLNNTRFSVLIHGALAEDAGQEAAEHIGKPSHTK